MKKYLAILSVLIVLLGGAVYLYSSQNSPPKTPDRPSLTIGHTPIPQPQIIAKEMGFFDEVGLDVTLKKFASANLAMEALTRGEIQGTGGIAYSTLFILENRNPGGFKIYEGWTENKETGWSNLIVKKNSGITSPEQLKGKKILMRAGLSSKSQGELVIKAMGLEMKDVEFVQMEPSLLVSGFAQPDISAYLDIQPVGTILVQHELGDVLIVSPRAKFVLDPFPIAAATLQSDWVQRHPEEAKKIKLANDKAIDYMRSHEAETRAIFQKYLNLEESVAKNIPFPYIGKVEEVDRAAINRLADIELGYKILDKKPDISNWFLK